jgi:lipoate-protein ligase A
MIEELKEIAEFIEDIDSKFTEIVFKWGREHGVKEDDIEKEMKKLMGSP